MGEDVDDIVSLNPIQMEFNTSTPCNLNGQVVQPAVAQHQQVPPVTIQHQQVPPVTMPPLQMHNGNMPHQKAVSTASSLHSTTLRAGTAQQSNNSAHKQRIRQYSSTSMGPFTVIIREIQMKMAPITFASVINDKYKSVNQIKRSQGKLKITLNQRDDANALVVDPYFGNYHVYIPADLVEIDGAISADDLCDMDDLQILISTGKGVFGNKWLSSCDILYAEQIYRVGGESAEQLTRIETNTIKITFAGLVLPSHIVIGGLRVKVRPFHKKPMFCDSCQSFGHTNKYCKRMPKCARCSETHTTESCTARISDVSQCAYCLTNHRNDRRECSFFNEVNESFKVRQSNRRRTRYDQAVAAAARSNNLDTNNVLQLGHAEQFPALQNRFSTLPVEDTPQPASPPPQPQHPSAQNQRSPPTNTRMLHNPYAKVVNEGSRPTVRARSTSKRRRTESPKPILQAQSSTARPSRRPETAQHATRAPGLPSNLSPTLALKIAIITFARHANVSQIWITLLEAIIDPLLQAILPQLTSIMGAIGPSVLSSVYQNA